MKEQPPIQCPECLTAIRYIPAGVSKKPPYKPYDEFWGCKNMECKYTWRPQAELKRIRAEIPVVNESEGNPQEKIVQGLRSSYMVLTDIKKLLQDIKEILSIK